MPSAEELEDAAAREATDELRGQLTSIARRAEAAIRLAEQQQADADDWDYLAGRLSARLRAVSTREMYEPLARRAGEAVEEGVTDARRRLGITSPRRRVMAPLDVIKAVANAPDQAAEELREAARLAEQARSPDDLRAALARAHRSVTRTERTARWAVNRSLSEGVRAVTDEAGVGRLWVPERDACVHCLAYAGRYVEPGDHFPGGLTFGEKPLRPGPVADPPLHPNCRCRTIPHRKEWGTEYGDALQREARRSVLRGWSRPSESERTRLKAADRLLKRAGDMPKSVQDYARTAVRRGSFPRGRAFPTAGTAVRHAPRRRLKQTEQRQAETAKTADPLRTLPRKSGESSMDADRQAVNPRFHEGREWQVNCQRATVAYELRRRGYDVAANPNRKDQDKQYTSSDLEAVWEGGRRFTKIEGPTSAELREAGRPATFSEQEKGRNDRARAVVSSWPPGARGWIVAEWKAGGAHIWNVEIGADGESVYLDAQSNTVLPNGEPHFSKAKSLQIMRVDDLTPTEEQAGMVSPRPNTPVVRPDPPVYDNHMTTEPGRIVVVKTDKGARIHVSDDGVTTACGQPVAEVYGPIGVSRPDMFGGRAIMYNCRLCEKAMHRERRRWGLM